MKIYYYFFVQLTIQTQVELIYFNHLPVLFPTQLLRFITWLNYPNRFFIEPDTIVEDTSKVFQLNPPIKLEKPTNVTIPLIDRVKYHFNTAYRSQCLMDKSFHWQNITFINEYEYFKVINNEQNNTLVMLGIPNDAKEIVIAHRPTFGTGNWYYNIDYQLIQLPEAPEGVKVHHRLFQVYDSNAKEVKNHLNELLINPKYEGYKVIIIGYSMGAGAATVHAAAEARHISATGHPVELITYLGPRVGNRHFVEHVVASNISIARYTYKHDLTHHIPPRIFEYVHLPGELYTPYEEMGEAVITCSQEFDEDPKCGWQNYSEFNLSDHYYPFNSYSETHCTSLQNNTDTK